MKPLKSTGVDRRRFLSQTSSLAGIALASNSHRVFASQRIRVGAIGVGGRGSLLIEQLPETAQIVAVADCNEPRALAFRDKLKADWQIYSDYR
ncbi:MAG: hypothetical protein ACKO9Q_32690, partial [Pirellula sp.]